MLGAKTKADYLVTGQWGEKAQKEAAKYCTSQFACNTKASKFTTIPEQSEWKLDAEAAYVHYCMNETVNGVEFATTPDVGEIPLVADMSSNFMSRPIEVRKHADNASMYNTPSCFTIYVMGEYLNFTKKKGGVAYWTDLSAKKSKAVYDAIDGSDGFYSAPVEKSCRSRMNIPFVINGDDEALTKKFLSEAQKVKLFTLAGHRSVGGCRASIYNGMPVEGVDTLVSFMKSFQDENRA